MVKFHPNACEKARVGSHDPDVAFLEGGMTRSGVTAFLVATGLFAGCGDGDGERGPRAPIPVRVKVVDKSVNAPSTRYSGTIVPATRVDLAFRVGGYIQQILQVKDGPTTRTVQEGDAVKKGTVLATVRQADYLQRAAQANAAVAEAIAAEKQAQIEFDRTKLLFEKAAVPQAELDTATNRLETARARNAAARAQAGESSLAVGDTRLVSPIDGVILERNVEVGSLVAPGSLAIVVADTSSVKVVFGAPDVLAEKLTIGSKLTVMVETKTGALDAKVTRIAPSADPKARVFDVEATLPNADGSLKTGMIATLEVPTSSLAVGAVLLPLTAVVRSPKDPRGFATFVVDGAGDRGTVTLREVELGDVLGNEVLAVQGLAPGDRVVSQGATIVTDGAAVRVVP
jgi:RND family efflux transporter MFP subunit